MKISIIIPTYNEKENLPVLVQRIFNLKISNLNLIIIDDNSPDQTGQLADDLSKKYPIQVIHRRQKMGLGSAYRLGFGKALNQGADLIFEMDADLSHNPADLPKFIQAAEQADIVLGSRYRPGGKIIGWSLWRKFCSRTGNQISKIVLGLKPKDVTTGFRCYKKEILKKIPYQEIKSEGYSWQEEILLLGQKHKAKIQEIPITFVDRKLGQSKFGWPEIWDFFKTLIRLKTKPVKLIIEVLFILLFGLANLFIISFLSLISGNLFLEMFKWGQIIIAIFVLLYLFKKINKVAAFLSAGVVYLLYLITAAYFIVTQSQLDFHFLKRNIGDINSILPNLFYPLTAIFVIALIGAVLFYKFQPIIKNKFVYLLLLLIIVFSLVLGRQEDNNELFNFIKSIYHQDNVINYYQTVYSRLIESSIRNKNDLIWQIEKVNRQRRPEYLDNIIILQLESLNGFLVNEKNTPNFIKIAQTGIFFPEFYSNSVETIISQENLLCSLPTSFKANLTASNLDKKITCLPEILGYLNYKTFFLKSYRLDFAQTGEFMDNLSFDEVHADTLMQPGDPQYLWGYREDIFYKRVFNYLKENIKEKYNFIYIEIGPTNHWPFSTPPDLKNFVPYDLPKKFQEKLINTTFLQDRYLKIAWEELNNLFPKKNYTLFILGDHGWPAGFHKNNTFNQNGAYEENFITSMAMVIGQEEKYINKIVTAKCSQMDILPTILDFFKINQTNNKFSRSLLKEINGSESPQTNIILIQPFADKYLSVITDSLKYQYNSRRKNFTLYDLKNDPSENNGQIISQNKEKNLQIIKKLLN